MQSHVSGSGTPQGGHSTYAGSECGDATSGINLMAGYQQQNNASMMQTQAPVIDGTTHESYPGFYSSSFISFMCLVFSAVRLLQQTNSKVCSILCVSTCFNRY